MTDDIEYGVVMAGAEGDSTMWFPSAREAWDYLETTIGSYVAALEEAGLVNQHADWEIFYDDLKAEALKPWTQEGSRIVGPDGKWYGVICEVD